MEKEKFIKKLKDFATELNKKLLDNNDNWSIKGLISYAKEIYPLSDDTKLISKVLELQLYPFLLEFADENGFKIELAKYQNYYPDYTLVFNKNKKIKYAIDLKTTYFTDKEKEKCNGFTLGSYGTYFRERDVNKNINYPYKDYKGHFCLCIIYLRNNKNNNKKYQYSLDELENIKSLISNFTIFATEKWKISSDKAGSGNTTNIGSIKNVQDLKSEKGIFVKNNLNEKDFDLYWQNYKTQTIKDNNEFKLLTNIVEYINSKDKK